MKVTKIVQKHFLCPFWGFLVTIICDVKNWRQYVWTSLCQFIFFMNLLHSLCVWFFDIWHLFDNLTSFWQFDIFLTHEQWGTWPMGHMGNGAHLLDTLKLKPPQPVTGLFFFYGSSVQAMAVQKIGRFGVNRQIIDLCHEGLAILTQCHLGICRGPFYLPKATFWEFLQLMVFS